MALSDFLSQWRNSTWGNRTTPITPTPVSSPTTTVQAQPQGYSESVPPTDPSWKGYSLIPNSGSGPQMVILSNGITMPLDALNTARAAAASEAASGVLQGQHEAGQEVPPPGYMDEFRALQHRYFGSGPITAEQNALYVRDMQALKAKYGMGAAPQPSIPPAGSLDVYNPGPYIAGLLRGQFPGYVFGTKVPRPNQVTLSEFLRLNPTQQQVLSSYVSAIGVNPDDWLKELQAYWLSGSQYKPVSWQ